MDKVIGEKYDQGKPRFSLLPLRALEEQVKVLTFGAEKYSPDGWRHVPNADERYADASLRHIMAYLSGEDYDSESNLHHLAHAQCCLSFMLELELDRKENEKP